MYFVQTKDEQGNFSHEVKVDSFDAWNVDATLLLVIHPLIKEFKSQGCGTPRIDRNDVPVHLLESYYRDWDDAIEQENYSEGYHHETWQWILDEIIWATDPDWEEMYDCVQMSTEVWKDSWDRRCNAMRLFGVYFFSMWS